MKIKILVISLILAISFFSFANGSQEAASQEGGLIKAAFLPQDMATESQSFSAKMFKKYAEDYGFEITVLDGKGDPQVQAQLVTNAIAQKFSVIFINPADINALIPSLMQAKQAGIVVAMFSSDVPAEKASVRDFFVGVNDNMAGEAAGQAFLNHFPDGANIVEIGGQAGHDAQNKRHDGFNKVIAGSNIKVIDYKACQRWSTADAMAIMEDMIVKHGDDIDGIFCHWDNGATGVIGALKAAGMEGKYIVAVDGNRAGFDQVHSKEQGATIMQNFENMTRKSLELAKSVLDGNTVEAVNYIPLDIVTLENISQFTPPEW